MTRTRTFVIGDIHGAYKAMVQCFRKSGFNHGQDRLIALGDVCDGWPEVDKVFDELCRVRELVYVIGNHDLWALQWAESGERPDIWLSQGGRTTIGCYPGGMPENHRRILSEACDYFIDSNRLFVHGGIDISRSLDDQPREELVWNRSLVQQALIRKEQDREEKITGYSQIFVGHTPTINYYSDQPVKACEVWLMDTGAGWHGRLSMMDLETGELFQSDPVPELYPDHPGRWL